MKIELSTMRAANELIDDRYAGWSRLGAYALVEYLEFLEEDLGESIEFDAVALRCDYSEYSADELIDAYPECLSSILDECGEVWEGFNAASEYDREQILEWFEDRTTIIPFVDELETRFIVQDF